MSTEGDTTVNVAPRPNMVEEIVAPPSSLKIIVEEEAIVENRTEVPIKNVTLPPPIFDSRIAQVESLEVSSRLLIT